MDGRRMPSSGEGLSLVELMVVLAIAGVLLAVAVPGFQRLRESTRMQAAVHRLMSDIVFTRSESIKRNRQVIMCPSAVARTGEATCGGIFADGWLVFEDSDRNRRRGPAEAVLRISPGLPESLTLTNRAANRDASERIVFQPDGSSRRNRTLMLCSRRQPEITSWSVVMNIIGRPRMARAWGECPGGEG